MFARSGYSVQDIQPHELPRHLKKLILGKTREFKKIAKIHKDMCYSGYYVTAKKRKYSTHPYKHNVATIKNNLPF